MPTTDELDTRLVAIENRFAAARQLPALPEVLGAAVLDPDLFLFRHNGTQSSKITIAELAEALASRHDLGQHRDVNISSPTDGAALIYDAGSGEWIDGEPPAQVDTLARSRIASLQWQRLTDQSLGRREIVGGFADELLDSTGIDGVASSGYTFSTGQFDNSDTAPFTGTWTTASYTGSDQSIVVPGGANRMAFKMRAGGGGGDGDGTNGGDGGGGAFVSGTIPVTPGETLVLQVGQAGQTVIAGGESGPGGGRSAIFRSAVAFANALAVAGAGGGAGDSNNSSGGGGGFPNGEESLPVNVGAGKGGTQSAGGAAGTGGVDGQAGAALSGGDAGNPQGVKTYPCGGRAGTTSAGGGGGDGYYGGGGASDPSGTSGFGGGGASSYTSPDVTDVIHGNASGQTRGNPSDPDLGNAGEGGTRGVADAENGLILYEFATATPQAASVVTDAKTLIASPSVGEVHAIVDAGGGTLGTDVIIELSRDDGTTWAASSLEQVDTDPDTGAAFLRGDVSFGGPAGTELRMRIQLTTGALRTVYAIQGSAE